MAIGGGHGLAATLEGLATWCTEITAVVSVADDGGSSGRLRRDLGIPAPGDMRRCLAALTPPGLPRDALEHRFSDGDLDGHAAGNIWLAALLESASNTVEALDVLAAMVGARGRILPSTHGSVDLVAHTGHGVVQGQVAVASTIGVERVSTQPTDPPVPIEVVAAIAEADAVVVGPGSLFTSVLAALVPGVLRAIEASEARVVYVANLNPKSDETRSFSLADHIRAVTRHGLRPDVVLADRAEANGSQTNSFPTDFELVFRTVAQPNSFLHDVDALGLALADLVRPVRA